MMRSFVLCTKLPSPQPRWSYSDKTRTISRVKHTGFAFQCDPGCVFLHRYKTSIKSCAMISDTPSISNMMRPGFTLAAQ